MDVQEAVLRGWQNCAHQEKLLRDEKVHAFHVNYVEPERLPLLETATRLLNCGKYTISSSMLTGVGGPMREAAAHVLWKVVLGLTLTEDEVRKLLFVAEPTARPVPGQYARGERIYDTPTEPVWSRMTNAPVSDDEDELPTATEGPLARPSRAELSEVYPGFEINTRPSGPSVLRGKDPVPSEEPVKMQSTFSRRRMARLLEETSTPLRGRNNHEASSSQSSSLDISTPSPPSPHAMQSVLLQPCSPHSVDDEEYESSFVTSDGSDGENE